MKLHKRREHATSGGFSHLLLMGVHSASNARFLNGKRVMGVEHSWDLLKQWLRIAHDKRAIKARST